MSLKHGLAALAIWSALSVAAMAAPSLKALLVDGQANPFHEWWKTSPIVKKALEETGLFTVEVATVLPGKAKEFKPKFSDYQVVVLNYKGEEWPAETTKAFEAYVAGGGGLVVFHAVNNGFAHWKAFNEMIGVGWGRDEEDGPFIYWKDGKIVRDMTPGASGDHGVEHSYQLVVRAPDHPVMKGLPEKFRHAPDELYAKLRGPAKNLTVLATAFSAPSTGGTGRNEPILMAIDYGKGRVFHSTMGHGPAQCLSVAFIVTLQRGAEWAATGKVTQKVPDDFPRPDKPVVRDWEKWRQSKQVVALASKEKDQSPGPWNDPADMSVWPNRVSHANSDPWLVFNHDKIRSMHPRVLLINFSNEQSAEQLMGIARQLIAALAEASRYHGYADQKAPAFLNYEVFKFVDLRDADRTKGDSRKVPLKNAGSRDGVDMSHAAYFSDQFAAYYKVPDPRSRNKRWLRLDELIDLGYVHEVWYFLSGAAHDPPLHNFEVIELKPQYNANFVRLGLRGHVQAGNGGDPDEPWTGRSLRIGYVNASRGVGCFVHSLGHGMEHTCTSGAIPYFSYYFAQYAGLDLRKRYGMPFNDLYGSHRNGQKIRYEDNAMIVPHDGQWLRIPNYVAAGGNVHFPPNARDDYDDGNTQPVPSTIEDWRIGSGPGHRDVIKPFTNAVFAKYNQICPDGEGAWQVYWRQNMPGLNNRQKDDFGRPMKNWWPFLFY